MPDKRKPECVMVIEDDTLVAQDIALRIAELGYDIAGIMSSGDEALQKIGQLKPDLVLLDIMIAGSLDGIETAGRIQLTAKIPVILLTAYTEHELLTLALNTSPHTWLQLPLNGRELGLKIELALLHHRMEEQTRITHQTLQQLQNKQQRDRLSLQRFSDAMDDSADAIYLIDRANMRFIDVNQTACERSGYSRGELLNMGPQDIKPYFNREMLGEKFDRIAATQNRFGIIETFHKGKNNEIYPVEVRLRATEAENRAIVVAIVRDMTLRDQNEQALRQSDEQFRQISQNLQHILWIRDIKTEQIIYISNAFEKIWGREVAQVYKRPRMLFADIHPEDRERITASVQRLWKEKHDMNEEYRLLRGDGETRWLSTRSFPICDHDGKIYRIGGVTEDITARKINEENMRLSEEKFRLLFEHSPIGLALVSTDFYLSNVNRTFCDMLGYSKEELGRKTFMDITHPDDIQIDLELGTQLLSGQISSYSLEKRYLTHQGIPLWIKLHGALINDKFGKPMFGLAMIENIDQQKQAETLRLAREAAQKNALVREVHHRIKNHLQGVVGLMRQHAQNNAQCSRVIEAAISQINVVATIHGLQGKEAGEDIDLLQMLTAISNSLGELLPAHFTSPIRAAEDTITLYLNRDESVPVALALNELMVNAAKHGSGPMDISLHCSSEHAIIHIENQSSHAMSLLQPGSGLELVRALLQTEGVAFSYEHGEHRFMAEILLTPPVIQFHRKAE